MQRQLAIERALTPAQTPVSYIRLRGAWLSNLGFKPGHRVQVIGIAPGVIELRFAETLQAEAVNNAVRAGQIDCPF